MNLNLLIAFLLFHALISEQEADKLYDALSGQQATGGWRGLINQINTTLGRTIYEVKTEQPQ